MRSHLLLLVSAAFLIGCARDPLLNDEELAPSASAAQVSADEGETFQLRIGEVAAIRGRGLVVGLRSVRNDSRCPTDVVCVWAGDAEVTVVVAQESRPWSASVLHTGIEPRETRHAGYAIGLVGLAPAPLSGESIEPSAYVASLRVTRE